MPSLLRVIAIAVLLAGPASAAAQSTGGSFGGSGFSGGSGGSSGGSSGSSGGGFSGSSGGWSGGTSGARHVGGGSGNFSPLMGIVFLVVALGCVIVVKKVILDTDRRRMGRHRPVAEDVEDEPTDDMHPSVLMLGIDWHARAELQAELARLAASGDTRSGEGRARLLSETVLALRRAEQSWLYVGYKDDGECSAADAEDAFKRAGADLRVRFHRELVRNADGRVTTADAGALSPHSNEGPGVVVVSILVVARKRLRDVATATRAAAIRRALSDRGALTGQSLVALEVVWSPAAEDDRMSTSELEQHYPELRKIDPASIAGRVFCAYCRGAFPMELLNCPHCGAPVTAPTGPGTPDTPSRS